MSDLVEKVKIRAKKISDENLAQAIEKTQKADNCIIKAQETGGRDKELVKEALILYGEAIELNSRLVQPYIGIAFINYSLGNTSQAIGLLNKAADIDPLHPVVNEMLALFSKEARKKNISDQVSKAADKSLSQKMNSKKEKKDTNIFAAIASIFIKSTKVKEPGPKKEDFAALMKETTDKMKIPGKSNLPGANSTKVIPAGINKRIN
jgi:hypothetical protein